MAPLKLETQKSHVSLHGNGSKKALASDALPLPVGVTNKFFILLFCWAFYYLMKRWREKIRNSTPLHIVNLGEMLFIIAQIASFIYLLGFFGIDYVQPYVQTMRMIIAQIASSIYLLKFPSTYGLLNYADDTNSQPRKDQPKMEAKKEAILLKGKKLGENSDEDLACAVSTNQIPSYSLEAELGDCVRTASVRKRAVELLTGRSLKALPISGFDYASVLGQCCEMVIGHVQIPVGIAGPLKLDGIEFMIPMATTEGCLVARPYLNPEVLQAPVVKFPSAKRAAELMFYLEDENNFHTISTVFNRTLKRLP